MAISAFPIYPVRTVSGNQPEVRRIGEESAQTFVAGTIVQISTDGYVKAWDGTDVTDGIAGVTFEDGANLTTEATREEDSFGSVPFQSSAKNIYHGAPFNDGKNGFYVANSDTIFSARLGNNGSTATPAAADVGISYGLTIDSDSKYWYVDKNKTDSVVVVAIDPQNTSARVHFKFKAAAALFE